MANEQIKGFANNLAASAFYDWCKNNLAGPAMTAAVVALWGKMKHGSLDWVAIAGMFFFSLVLMVLSHKRSKAPEPPAKPESITPPLKPSELFRAQESRRLCDEERREVLKRLEDATSKLNRLCPLQWEALAIAKDLRDFYVSMGPFLDAPLDPNESDAARAAEAMTARSQRRMTWRAKLRHGYVNREFGQRITSLMHRLGEEYSYPTNWPNYAEAIPLGEDDIRKLIGDMDMVVVWLDNKEFNEVSLLR